jgi:hypothetical protein
MIDAGGPGEPRRIRRGSGGSHPVRGEGVVRNRPACSGGRGTGADWSTSRSRGRAGLPDLISVKGLEPRSASILRDRAWLAPTRCPAEAARSDGPRASAKTPTPPKPWRPRMRFAILTALLLVSTGLAFADPIEVDRDRLRRGPDVGNAERPSAGLSAVRCIQRGEGVDDRLRAQDPSLRNPLRDGDQRRIPRGDQGRAPCPTEADLTARLAESAAALKAVFPNQATPEPSGPEPSLSTDETGS